MFFIDYKDLDKNNNNVTTTNKKHGNDNNNCSPDHSGCDDIADSNHNNSDTKKKTVEREDIISYPVPMSSLARKINPKIAKLVTNIIYVGVLAELLGKVWQQRSVCKSPAHNPPPTPYTLRQTIKKFMIKKSRPSRLPHN